MSTVKIHQAKAQLSKLVDKAARGESFVIAKAGKPLVKVAALDAAVAPRVLQRGLLDNGYAELPITSQHAASIAGLPPVHKDPFDRLLLAQALTEGITLVTSDARLAQYSGPVRTV